MRRSRPFGLILALALLVAVGLLSPAAAPPLLRLPLSLIQAIAQEGAGGERVASPEGGLTDTSALSPWAQASESAPERGDGAARTVSLEAIQAAVQEAAPEDGNFVVVGQRNKFFDSPVVVIHEGDTVVWVNETAGAGWHDVQSYEGEFSSDRMLLGDTYVHTFDEVGTYGYFCTPHVFDGMQGVVVVLPAGAPLPDPLPLPDSPLNAPSAPAEPLAPDTPDTIATVAGGGGAGGPAANASLYLPEGVAIDAAGRLYVADTGNCQVRRVQPTDAVVSILGHESCGFSMGADADIGPWLHANHPRGVALRADGALYVADTINCRVRIVDESGRVATVAGNGSCRASGDGGPAVEAGLAPWGLALNTEGNLYIADVFNCRIRKVDGLGIITTVAGAGSCGFSGDGGAATEARLFFPRDVAAGPDGALYIADSENCRVRRVDPSSGTIDTVAGDGTCTFRDGLATEAGIHPWALAVDVGGDILVADRENCRIRRFSVGGAIISIAGSERCGSAGDGGPATQASLYWPSDITLGRDGSVYIADTGNCRIRSVDGGGVINTVVGSGVCASGGDGGAATSGGAWHPMGMAFGKQGEWFFSELDTCKVRRVDASGVVTTYAGIGICGHSGDGGPATEARLGDFLGGLALADDGSLFIAEGFNCRVRRITPDQRIETIAGNGVCGFSGDGGPATEASLDLVFDVALDGDGGLYLAGPFNCRVRRIDLATGLIDTVVGDGSCRYNGEDVPALEAGVEPWGVAVGPDGALYLADSGNGRVRRVGAEGLVTTVAGGNEFCDVNEGDGGPATEARLLRPYDVVLDRAGNLYVSDLRGFTIRKVDAQGIITTVAGVGISRPIDNGGTDPTNGFFCSIHSLPVPAPSYLGDGGPADEAGLYFPYSIALNSDGHLFIADTFDHRVRRVACGGAVPCAESVVSVDTPGDAPDDETPPVALPETGRPGQPYDGVSFAGPIAFLVATLVLLAALVGLRRRRASRN